MSNGLFRPLALACGGVMLAAAALLGATPAQAFKINYQHLSDNYDPNELHYAGDDRDFWTVVLGNPFGAPQQVVDGAVTDAMSDTRWGKRTHFTTTPDDSARTSYRIIMLINGNTATGQRICGYHPDQPLGPGDHGSKVHVVATFCRGAYALTQAVGSVDAAGVDDPEFRRFIRQLMANLLPMENPNRPRGDGIRARP
jgi:hypothetical protein